ncbi:HNH endonuclease [bacterium]|nr:MAG: HNH endonuclease [bacterium]
MAAKFTPSQAKNFIRRSLKGVHDPQPTRAEILKLRGHFEERCAFCSVELPAGKKGFHLDHLDHLDPAGPNHVSNRVPACATCNEVEKRELPWEPFLYDKSPSAVVYVTRRSRILAWVEQTASLRRPLPADALRAIRLEEARAISTYEASLAAVRAIVKHANATPTARATDEASLTLWDLYAVVNLCALRFDGYAYEAATGTPMWRLADRFVETRVFSAEQNENHAAFFALQRHLFKWGGEQLPTTWV